MNQNAGHLHAARSHAAAVGTPQLHAPTLAHLVRALGAPRGTDFLDVYEEDLAAALTRLHAAMAASDLALLQRASHDLIALAGTAAASGVEHAARLLSQSALDGDTRALGDPARQLGLLSAGLIAEIQDFRTTSSAGWLPR